MAKVLVIEEDTQSIHHLREILSSDHQIHTWPNGKDLQALLRKEEYEIVLLGLQLENADGFALLEQVRTGSPHTPVLVISRSEETSLIVKAVKAGAFDFLGTAFSREKLLLSMERALEHRNLRNEIDYLRRQQDVVYDFAQIIAASPVMKKMIETLKKFSRTDSTILMTGETGTGKSFLSGSVHFNSKRRTRPFITINCANISETLLESELFGHEKGAFTGANKTRVGRLEQGRGGTVFLDEIGEMSPALQAKLLRVLEDKAFERVGGNRTIHSDVRIIAATNKKPEEQVATGELREDLYYRINVLRVHLPPLRERRECIQPLAHNLLDKTLRSLKKRIDGFSPEALEAILSFSWPGNIRQLANTIERAAILEETQWIQPEHILLPELTKVNFPPEAPPPALRSLDYQEKEIIIRALEESLWVQKEAANRLSITPRALNYKIKKYGITHDRWRKHR